MTVHVPPGLTLRPFQSDGVAFATKHKRCLIADEMGLGKTVQAIVTASSVEARSILVVCPASLRENWRSEIETWDAQHGEVVLCDTGADVEPAPADGRLWCITNPERLIATAPPSLYDALCEVYPATTLDAIRARLTATRNVRVRGGEKAARFDRLIWKRGWTVSLDDLKAEFPEVDFASIEAFQAPNPERTCVLVIEPCKPTEYKRISQSIESLGTVWTHVFGNAMKRLQVQERAGRLWQALMEPNWDLLILDEAHRLKNLDAACAKRIYGMPKRKGATAASPGLVSKSNRVIALTGTPMPNRVRELWPLVSTLRPDVFPKEFGFLYRYCGPTKQEIFVRGGGGRKKTVTSFDGASNVAELQKKLSASCMIRRTKAQVLPELPPKVRQIIPLSSDGLKELIEKEREGWLSVCRELDTMSREALLARAIGDTVLYDQALESLQQKVSGLPINAIAKERRALALAKLPLVVDHCKSLLESKQKIVVMAHHVAVIEALREALREFGCVCIYGGVDEDERRLAVKSFQELDGIRVFVGGIHVAGVGLTLTSADTLVFAESDWQPAIVSQAEDRIHRIGQHNSVLIQHLVVDGSIEANIILSAVRKQQLLDQLLDGMSPAAPKQPDRKRVYPVATAKECIMAEYAVKLWAGKTPGVPRTTALNDRVLAIVDSMCERFETRKPTNGEVWLCKRLVAQNKKSLPSRLVADLSGSER